MYNMYMPAQMIFKKIKGGGQVNTTRHDDVKKSNPIVKSPK
jgi:hypothetical protein